MKISSAITDIAVHTVTIIPPVTDSEGVQYNEYGEVIPGDLDNELVSCFIDLRRRRVLDSNNRIIVYDATITFPPDVDIGIDWKVKDGKDLDGNVLLEEATVISLDIFQHPQEGVVGKTASVVAQ